MLTKKKDCKEPLCQKGDTLIFKRFNDYRKKTEFHLVFILDAWYIKTNHYLTLTMEQWRGSSGLDQVDVIEFSERKFVQWYGNYNKNKPGLYSWKPLPLDDLSFLVVCGSPRECVKRTLKSMQFRRKIQGMITRGQKIVDRWQDINSRVGEYTKKMEAEDGEAGNP